MLCKICGNSQNNQSYQVREMMFGFRDTFIYFECSKCGCLQIKDIPLDMSTYYPSYYYSFSEKPEEEFKNPIKNWLRKFRDSYAVLNQGWLGWWLLKKFPNYQLRPLNRIHITRNSEILDVGCGAGKILYTLWNAGFKNLTGIDPYIKTDIVHQNGLTIKKTTIHKIRGSWDLIIFNHAFEHLPDPLETLQSTSRLLKQGGVCFLRTPTVSSWAWKHYKINWVNLDAPRHFFIHSTQSLELLATKTGLKLEATVYDSDEWQFIGSEQYLRDIPLLSDQSFLKQPQNQTFSLAEIESFKNRAKVLNEQKQGDVAIFYLKK